MKFPLYSIRDTKAGSFQTPVVSANDFTITRSFGESIVNRRDPIISFSPADFDLFQVGEFETDTGIVTPLAVIRLVCNAAEVLSTYGKTET